MRSTWAFARLKIANLIFAAVFLIATASIASAKVPKVEFSEARVPELTEQQMSDWYENFIESDEVFWFDSRDSFINLVTKSGLDFNTKRDLIKSYSTTFEGVSYIRATFHQKIHADGGYAVVPVDLLARLPHDLLQKMYSHQYEKKGTLPGINIAANSMAEMKEILSAFNLSSPHFEDRAFLEQNVFQLGDKFYFVINKLSWPSVPELERRALVDPHTFAYENRKGLDAKITLHKDDDIAATAVKFAGERDPKGLEKYLRKLLGSSDSVEIPLSKIMHPFMRKMGDGFSSCHGPNCYNAALGVNSGNKYRLEYTEPGPLNDEIVKNYRPVKRNEPLQSGDYILYRHSDGTSEHAASYVGDGVVITKNGWNKFNPYIYQKSETVEKNYFKKKPFKISVFRKPKAGELTIEQAGGIESEEDLYYRVNSTLFRDESTSEAAAQTSKERIHCLRRSVGWR